MRLLVVALYADNGQRWADEFDATDAQDAERQAQELVREALADEGGEDEEQPLDVAAVIDLDHGGKVIA